MNQLNHLISRCATALEADREFDADIWWQIDRRSAGSTYNRAAFGLPKSLDEMPDTMPAGLGRLAVRISAPKYTSSIDAAITLIPVGLEYSLTILYGEARIEVGLNLHEGPFYATRKDDKIALAICYAALQACDAIVAKGAHS